MYRIVLFGTQKGCAISDVSQAFQNIFKITPEKSLEILTANEFVIKRTSSKDEAEKYIQVISQAGGKVILIDEDETLEIETPEIASPLKDNVNYSEIEQFLKDAGLSHLAPIMEQHSINFNILNSLTDDDLKAMGIEKIGDRKTLVNAIRSKISEEEKAAEEIKNSIDSEAGKKASTTLTLINIISSMVWGIIFANILERPVAAFFIGALLVFFFTWLYFLPTLIAFKSQTENRWLILFANFFFGATIFGWVLILLYSKRLVSDKEAATLGVIGAIAGIQ